MGFNSGFKGLNKA